MPRLKLTLAYQGTAYAGWQLQSKEVCPGTVQGEIERAVARITGYRIPVHGAGRTDSGVHAEGQVCHLDLEDKHTHIDWHRAINVNLPPDIRILDAAWTDKSFHSRKSAKGKRYAYSLWMHTDRAYPRIAPFVWSVPPIDLSAASPIIPLLTGRRDFATMQNSGTKLKNTVKTVYSISIQPGVLGPLFCPAHWPVATIIVEGDGFLKQMVRNIVGLLVWVAQGKVQPEEVEAIMLARNRAALPSPSAAAQGLTLLEVLY